VGLTPRQLEAVAVEQTPRDTCVVAGPGSGKTTVLVAHFERLVESGVDPLRILAITFTDKAANNMRDKLAHAFRDRAETSGKLERAYVSTVHGFCARLLKENAVFAGLDPEFHVMDERESAREQRRAIDETLDSMFAVEPDRMRALMRALAANDAGGEVLDAYDAIRAAGVKVGDLARFAAPPTVDIAAAIGEVRNLRPPGWKFDQQAHLQEAQDWVARIAAALPNGPEPTLRAMRSFTCKLTKLQRGNRAYDLLKSFKDDLLPDFEYSTVTEYYAAERATIIELFARFDGLYRERKRHLSALDYDDLEESAVRLLEDHPEVQRRLQNQFDQVLMDEYQDTNGQQAKLLNLLRPPDRFYAVGDINQSIYGFRHAEPRVFREYRDAVEQGGKRLVQLVENFRSRPEILRAVEGGRRRRRHRDAASDRGPAVSGQGGAVGGGAVGDYPRVGGAVGGRAHSGAEMRITGRRPLGAQLRSAPRIHARFRRVRHSLPGQSRERLLRDARSGGPDASAARVGESAG
jgi:ATP-dependent helicase/nuclease subunit A